MASSKTSCLLLCALFALVFILSSEVATLDAKENVVVAYIKQDNMKLEKLLSRKGGKGCSYTNNSQAQRSGAVNASDAKGTVSPSGPNPITYVPVPSPPPNH